MTDISYIRRGLARSTAASPNFGTATAIALLLNIFSSFTIVKYI
jgi:hypothetical protein